MRDATAEFELPLLAPKSKDFLVSWAAKRDRVRLVPDPVQIEARDLDLDAFQSHAREAGSDTRSEACPTLDEAMPRGH